MSRWQNASAVTDVCEERCYDKGGSMGRGGELGVDDEEERRGRRSEAKSAGQGD
jgi:hypothetical protein